VPLLVLQDPIQQLARAVILELHGLLDRRVVVRHRLLLGVLVARDHLLHGLPDVHRGELRHRGHPLQEQDSLDEHLRVTHFVPGLLLDRLVKRAVAPLVAHLGVDHVLADGGQFLGEEIVQRR